MTVWVAEVLCESGRADFAAMRGTTDPPGPGMAVRRRHRSARPEAVRGRPTGAEAPAAGQDLVFVGNSRRVRRPVVAGAVASGLPLRIYGLDWKGVVPDANLMDGTVRNEMVGDLYRGAGIVLNDHWDDMRRWGFVSNRLFDAVACGVPVVSDAIEGLDTLTSGVVRTFASEEELPGLLADTLSTPPDAAALRQAAEAVIADHSFARRAARFDEVLRGEDAERARFRPVRAA